MNDAAAQHEFQSRFVSEMLWARSVELAELAARSLLHAHPILENGYRPLAQIKWREHLARWVSDLAASIWARDPRVFAEQIRWADAAFEARDVPRDHLAWALDALGRTIAAEVPPEDAPLVRDHLAAGREVFRGAALPLAPALEATSAPGRVAAAYLSAVLGGDRLGAAAVVIGALRSGMGVVDIYTKVLVSAEVEVGRMWHEGEITIADEHLATAATQMVMAELLLTAPREPHDGRVAIAASVRPEGHDLGVRMVADLLELAGWRVAYLGSGVPAEDAARACADYSAHLAALSAALPAHLRVMEDTIAEIRRSSPAIRVLVGGRAFSCCPDLWKRVGADAYAADAAAAVGEANRLVPAPMNPGGRR